MLKNTNGNLISRAVLIWFTGLSGAGKSTLSEKLADIFRGNGIHTQILDGDILRKGLCNDLGFNRADRSENIRRAGEVAKILVDNGTLALAAFISPTQEDRDKVRNMMGAENFIEIYCKCSLEICEARDTKGLYKKARAGEIKHMIGIDELYEEPTEADVVVDTGLLTVEESINAILLELQKKFLLGV